MRVIGITGSIACGKTTVSRELLRQGFPVIDGDILSRKLTASGGAAIPEIRASFGERYIADDGSLNRREMSRLVFSEPKALEKLDLIMAPYLQEATLAELEQARNSGARLCFLDMPLLYEKGYDRYCDTVWCVWLPEELQLQRLMTRDGFSREEALSRINAVMSTDEKANRSSVVINNSGSVEDTLIQVSELLQRELLRSDYVPRRRRSDNLSAAPRSVSPGSASSVPVPDLDSFDRPAGSRKQASSRKSSWVLPVPFRIALITLTLLLAISLTAQLLMRAYLTRCSETHIAEQHAIDNRYPLMYRELINQIAAEYNLAPSLIAAIILNESSFKPSAESAVGARGLMQLMPDTAEWIAHKLRLENYSQDRLEEPDFNIRLGCWYLNYLSTLFKGDPLCVVCSYHAGQGEISSWLSNPLYSSDGTTLIRGNLPEGPTKIYAGRVIRDYGIYQEKYYTPIDHTDSGSDSGDPG